jgi:hypothetical protein
MYPIPTFGEVDLRAGMVPLTLVALLAAPLLAAQDSPQAAPLAAREQIPAAKPGQDEGAKPPAPAPNPPRWYERISLSGFLAADTRWRRAGEDAEASTTSDLYLRAFELGIEADVDGWLSATAVINSEYVGDPLNGGEGAVVVDEAHLDIDVPRTPLYFVIGKRTQPFGLFDTSLVTDPLVQDAYETKTVGLTVGVKAPRETDLSITAYKGRALAGQLARSSLLGPESPDLPEIPVARLDSWIVSGLSSPAGRNWRLSAAFASEPGLERRLTTLCLGSNLSLPFDEHIELNAEYMKALRRDGVPDLDRSFREQALSATVTYLLIAPKTRVSAGRNYRARRKRRFAHPVLAALRFEALDDGGRAAALGTWTVRNRISLGGRYTFYRLGDINASMSVEYRRQTIRVSPVVAGPIPQAHELYLRFGLDF